MAEQAVQNPDPEGSLARFDEGKKCRDLLFALESDNDALADKVKADHQRLNRFALMIAELADEDDERSIVVEAREYLEGGE